MSSSLQDANIVMQVVDSHTGGEPTRVIVSGGPDLGGGTLPERLIRFRQEFDEYRRMAILEPRGSDVLVGALLCKPDDGTCVAGVIFFNNTGYLNMCGHGAIGVAVTLMHLGRVGLGVCRVQTPVGVVEADLKTANTVAIENVPSYRYRKDVAVNVDEMGTIVGDIAWGGNWFFLVENSPLPIATSSTRELTDMAMRIRRELRRQNVTGADGAEIDHLEFFSPPPSNDADSQNFVLCPGGAYDRSPCGTGTSAKLACLAEDEKLQPGQAWIQESVLGSRFVGTYRRTGDGLIVPTIAGDAYVTGEGRLIGQLNDPFCHGFTAKGAS